MNIYVTYLIIAAVLVALELCYFKVADRFNIIDKPNERSSHSTIVLRGGGVIFAISMLVWFLAELVSGFRFNFVDSCHDLANHASMMALAAQRVQDPSFRIWEYLPFIIGLVLIAGVSFWDDVHSLPDSVRLLVQFTAMGLMLYQLMMMDNGYWTMSWWGYLLAGIAGLIVCVGATNIINFMDGINGITAGYSLAVLVPLMIKNKEIMAVSGTGFIEPSFLMVAIIGVLVFSWFNFRPKGKAKCFAGDVGSIGIAFIMLFAIGRLIVLTGDITYMILLLVYGVDGCLTIAHRIMLHENLGEAHRKHAFQLMANELKIGHVEVTLLYMALQLVVSLGFICLCPDTVLAHWICLVMAGVLLAVAYVLFMRKYYHLHEEYLRSIRKQ